MADPRMVALSNGLVALPTSAAVQPPAATEPQAAPPAFNPLDDPSFRAFLADKAAQLRDLQNAQAQVAAARGSAGTRVGNFLSRLGGAPEGDIQMRYERMGQPVKDVLARQQAARDITAGGVTQQQLEGQARQNQLAVMMQDPNSPISRRQAMLVAPLVGPDVASRLAASDIDLALKSSTTGGDLAQKLAEAANLRASAVKTEEETRLLPASTQAEIGLKGAQAEQAGAEAAYKRMLTGGEVVPGLHRGKVAIDEAQAKELNNQFADYSGSRAAIDEIEQIVGDKNMVVNGKLRAEIQPRLAALVGQLRSSAGMRSLAGPEMEFAKKLIADPTGLNLPNAVGYTNNKQRFESLKAALDTKWNATKNAWDLQGRERHPVSIRKTLNGKNYEKRGGKWFEVSANAGQ